MTTYLRLLYVFSWLSILGFGGGKGIIPQMHTDAVTQYHWVTSDQFSQFYAIGKLAPGPTTIFAALVGSAAGGLVGALVATAGMFVPSSVLMVVMDSVWSRWKNVSWKGVISRGLAPVIVGLVWSSVVSIGRGSATGIIAYTMAGVVALLVLRTKLGAPLLILASGAVGIAVLR